MLVREVVDKVRFFEQAKGSIRSNGNYSEQGKERALKNLQESVKVFQPVAVKSLKSEWSSVRRRYFRNQEKARDAEHAEGERWNYERLNYESERVRERIKNAGSLREIEDTYKQVSFSGSRERWRAWAEVGQGLVQKKFSQEVGSRDLERTMKQDFSRMVVTSEMEQVHKDGERLVNHADELWEQTNFVRNYFVNAGTIALNGSDFTEMLEGISVTKKVDAKTLTTYTTLDIQEPELVVA